MSRYRIQGEADELWIERLQKAGCEGCGGAVRLDLPPNQPFLWVDCDNQIRTHDGGGDGMPNQMEVGCGVMTKVYYP